MEELKLIMDSVMQLEDSALYAFILFMSYKFFKVTMIFGFLLLTGKYLYNFAMSMSEEDKATSRNNQMGTYLREHDKDIYDEFKKRGWLHW